MEFVRIVKTQGAGFVPYMWPKAGSDIPVRRPPTSKDVEPCESVVVLDGIGRLHRHRERRAIGKKATQRDFEAGHP